MLPRLIDDEEPTCETPPGDAPRMDLRRAPAGAHWWVPVATFTASINGLGDFTAISTRARLRAADDDTPVVDVETAGARVLALPVPAEAAAGDTFVVKFFDDSDLEIEGAELVLEVSEPVADAASPSLGDVTLLRVRRPLCTCDDGAAQAEVRVEVASGPAAVELVDLGDPTAAERLDDAFLVVDEGIVHGSTFGYGPFGARGDQLTLVRVRSIATNEIVDEREVVLALADVELESQRVRSCGCACDSSGDHQDPPLAFALACAAALAAFACARLRRPHHDRPA